jgi:hypothetical protein
MRHPTEAQFLKDVATHEMTVLWNHDQHRHLRFRRPGTYCMGFDIITWPGYLCICGDMGDYVFARTVDMFGFFRGSIEGPLKINPSYWAEKTRNNQTIEYSADSFRAMINSRLEGCGEVSPELREAVRDEVLCHADDEWRAIIAAHDFEHGRFRFEELYERSYKDWTYHFIWCCYAVTWAIRQHDIARAKVPA